MIKLINKNSGGDMWAHEDRLDEYLAAGHKLAASPKPEHPLAKEPDTSKVDVQLVKEQEKPKKTTRKKG